MFRHIVLFRVRDDVSDSDVLSAIEALRRLDSAPGVMEWTIELSLDTRKGRIIVEDGTFADEEAFAAWRDGEQHRSVAHLMAQLADWWVGDWVI